jgi:hypothetical protein
MCGQRFQKGQIYLITGINDFFFFFFYYYFLVICLFFQEQIYIYIILYTQWFSTQKLQCKKVYLRTF